MSYAVGEVIYDTRVPNRMGVIVNRLHTSKCGRYTGYEIQWLNGSRKGKSEFRAQYFVGRQADREAYAKQQYEEEIERTKRWTAEAKLQVKI